MVGKNKALEARVESLNEAAQVSNERSDTLRKDVEAKEAQQKTFEETIRTLEKEVKKVIKVMRVVRYIWIKRNWILQLWEWWMMSMNLHSMELEK